MVISCPWRNKAGGTELYPLLPLTEPVCCNFQDLLYSLFFATHMLFLFQILLGVPCVSDAVIQILLRGVSQIIQCGVYHPIPGI